MESGTAQTSRLISKSRQGYLSHLNDKREHGASKDEERSDDSLESGHVKSRVRKGLEFDFHRKVRICEQELKKRTSHSPKSSNVKHRLRNAAKGNALTERTTLPTRMQRALTKWDDDVPHTSIVDTSEWHPTHKQLSGY